MKYLDLGFIGEEPSETRVKKIYHVLLHRYDLIIKTSIRMMRQLDGYRISYSSYDSAISNMPFPVEIPKQ